MNFPGVHLLFAVLLVLCAPLLYAQPSDAQIIKDLTGPNVISVELSAQGGAKAWSSAYQQYFWERGAVIYSKANVPEYPNARVRTGGLASYTLIGTQATFKRFDVAWKDYEGIPAPTEAEVLQLLRSNLEAFVGRATYNKIVGEVEELRVADEPKTQWHTPNHFSQQFLCIYKKKTSIYQLGHMKVLYKVDFYRDAINSPWKGQVIASVVKEETLGTETYTQEELAAMKTLGQVAQEAAANEAIAALGAVSLPDFQSEMEVFLFIHSVLLENDPNKFEAVMMKMLAPVHFVQGSEVLLNANGVNLINQNAQKAFRGKFRYADFYCSSPSVKTSQSGSIEFYDKAKKYATRISIAPFGGRYERGVKVGQTWKIVSLNVAVSTSQDDFDYVQSFPAAELCPD